MDTIATNEHANQGFGRHLRQLRFDVGARPFLVLMELTRACDLACRHCRADSVLRRDPAELSTDELFGVFDDLASLGAPRPRVVLTGGDPLQRPDLDDLVRHAASAGLSVAVSPAGTPRATEERFVALRAAGAGAASLSIDGESAVTHDAFRRVDGSFDWTVKACRAAIAAGLRLQVNTTVSADTVRDLPGIAKLVSDLGAMMWSVFFVVPVGRGQTMRPLEADETEDVLHFLHYLSPLVPLKTTEAPAYRRVIVQAEQGGAGWQPGVLYRELRDRLAAVWPEALERDATAESGAHDHSRRSPSEPRRAPLSVGDGRGVVFVSHRGDVQPSGFLPLVAGNVRQEPLTRIYAGSPLLRDLREPSLLGGRCGRCQFASVCGGSRSQAYGRFGDPLAEDGSCPYIPEPVVAEQPAVLSPS